MAGDEYDWLYQHKKKSSNPKPVVEPVVEPRKRRRGGRLFFLIVAAWLIFMIGVPLWAFSQIARVAAEPDGERPVDTPGTTYVLVGSDSRENLSDEERKELKTGKVAGARTDTIMIMHVGSGPTLLMSIPRDSYVDIPGHGRTKINAAFAYGGASQLVETLESETGLRIDNYVEIGLGGFADIVDALGGVEICPKEAIKDKDAGLDIPGGCQQADGKTALGYARSRHTYTTQDIQRIQSQREVLGAIAHEAKSWKTVVNPVRYWTVANSSARALIIGENVGPLALGRFGWNLSSAMSGGGLNCTVPIADFSVRWDRDRALEVFGLIAADNTSAIDTRLCTADGLPPKK